MVFLKRVSLMFLKVVALLNLQGFWLSPKAVYSYVRLHYIRLSVVVQNFARRARSEPDVVSKVH